MWQAIGTVTEELRDGIVRAVILLEDARAKFIFAKEAHIAFFNELNRCNRVSYDIRITAQDTANDLITAADAVCDAVATISPLTRKRVKNAMDATHIALTSSSFVLPAALTSYAMLPVDSHTAHSSDITSLAAEFASAADIAAYAAAYLSKGADCAACASNIANVIDAPANRANAYATITSRSSVHACRAATQSYIAATHACRAASVAGAIDKTTSSFTLATAKAKSALEFAPAAYTSAAYAEETADYFFSALFWVEGKNRIHTAPETVDVIADIGIIEGIIQRSSALSLSKAQAALQEARSLSFTARDTMMNMEQASTDAPNEVTDAEKEVYIQEIARLAVEISENSFDIVETGLDVSEIALGIADDLTSLVDISYQ